MAKINYTTTKQGQQNADYSVKLIGTAEKSKNLQEIVHLPSVKTKKQVSDVAGERSFLYGMYLAYLEADSEYECQVSVDVLPTPEEATATTIEVEFEGTATSAIQVDFSFFDKIHSFSLNFESSVTPTQIVEAIITEAKKWEDIPFDVTNYSASDTKVTFTSRVDGSCGASTPVKAKIIGEGITSSITINAGTNSATADELINYINSKKEKNRLYIFEDGIDTTNFINELKKWQNYSNVDKRGRMIQTKVDTLENLIEQAEGLNESSQTILGLKKINKDGYNCGHIIIQPCYLSSLIAGVLNLCYTEGTNFGKINSLIPLGDPNNVSLPLAETILEKYTIEEGEEWLENEDGDEVQLLNDSGVSVFTINKENKLVIGDLVTTYTKDSEGNLDKNFHWMAFDECVSSFLSYLFNRQKRTMAHKRMESGITKANFIIDCQTGYKVCSGQETDSETKRSYKFVEPEGLTTFLNALKNNTVEDYADGKITSTLIETVVYSQLREIFMNYKFGYIS